MIISKMVGRDLSHRFPSRDNVPGDIVLEVEDFTSPFPKSFKNASFDLKKGEILGVGGLVGAQRTELMESIFGLRSVRSGTIKLNGKAVRINSPITAKKHGMALLTEERRVTGIFPMLNIVLNLLIANLSRYVYPFGGLLKEKLMKQKTVSSINLLRIKTPSPRTLIKNLSGGNQQKVLFARWLDTEPEILILDEPTRGIDVGAKYEIYMIMTELVRSGKSVIMISSEMPELLGMSDRIIVMCEGRISGILNSSEATEEKIMYLATRFMD